MQDHALLPSMIQTDFGANDISTNGREDPIRIGRADAVPITQQEESDPAPPRRKLVPPSDFSELLW